MLRPSTYQLKRNLCLLILIGMFWIVVAIMIAENEDEGPQFGQIAKAFSLPMGHG